MSARLAGQHARETTRRKALRSLLALASMVAAAVAIVLLGDLPWGGVIAVELLLISGVVVLNRVAAPVVERWGGGRLPVERIDRAWLSQAYAQRKWLESVTGRRATALLVFSRAYLVGKPVSRQRGVVVLPARMLAGHLRRYPELCSREDVQHLHDRLARVLAPTLDIH